MDPPIEKQNLPTKSAEAPKLATINDTDGDEGDDEGDDEVVLFVEMKYCSICHLEQPLRAKHCKNTDHCVATFDHYCPWIGNCVGERNKARFYYYLVV